MAQPRSEVHARYGLALRQLRTDRGFSQESLALAAGLDRAYVSGIERGERNPSLANLLKLAATIGVPTLRMGTTSGRTTGSDVSGAPRVPVAGQATTGAARAGRLSNGPGLCTAAIRPALTLRPVTASG